MFGDNGVCLSWDTSPPDGTSGVMAAFIGGDAARDWDQLDASARRQFGLNALAEYFGPQALNPIEYAEPRWTHDVSPRGDPSRHETGNSSGPAGWTTWVMGDRHTGRWTVSPEALLHRCESHVCLSFSLRSQYAWVLRITIRLTIFLPRREKYLVAHPQPSPQAPNRASRLRCRGPVAVRDRTPIPISTTTPRAVLMNSLDRASLTAYQP